jgi:hypothetical protein
MRANRANQAVQTRPQTTGQLLKYIIKQIPGRLLKSLPMAIVTGAGMLLLHTYVLVYLNDGFEKTSWYATNVLNIRGNLFNKSILWTSLGAALPLLLKGGNPFGKIAGFVKLPFGVARANRQSGGRLLPVICFAAAASLFAGDTLFAMNSVLLGGIAMNSAIAFAAGRGSVLIALVRQIAIDMQTGKNRNPNGDGAMALVGTAGAFMAVMGVVRVLPAASGFAGLLRNLWLPLLILGVALSFRNKGKNAPKQLMFLLCLFGTGCLLLHFGTAAFAHDGGWTEAQRSLKVWMKSPGAMKAVETGYLPALLCFLSSLLASTLSDLSIVLAEIMKLLPPDEPETPEPETPEPDAPEPGTPAVTLWQTGPDGKPLQLFLAADGYYEDKWGNAYDPNEINEIIRQRKENDAYSKRQVDAANKKNWSELNDKATQDAKRKAIEAKLKAENDAANLKLERQIFTEKTQYKYNIYDQNKLMEFLNGKKERDLALATSLNKAAVFFDKATVVAEYTVRTCEAAIDTLAFMTDPTGMGLGTKIKAGFKFAKHVALQAGADPSLTNLAKGVSMGAVDATMTYAKFDNTSQKLAANVFAESLKGAIDSGSLKGAASGAAVGANKNALEAYAGILLPKNAGTELAKNLTYRLALQPNVKAAVNKKLKLK